VCQQIGDDAEVQDPVGERVRDGVNGAAAILRHDRVDLLTQEAEDHRLQRNHGGERPPRRASRRVCDGHECDGDERRRGEKPGTGLKRPVPGHRRLCPCDQTIGLHRRANVGARERQLFSKVEGAGDLHDRLLPLANLGGVRRRPQPPGKRVFACTRAREREQLEERAAAEQIHIVRVRVTILAESVAGLASTHPTIFEPGETALVEGQSSDRGGPRLEHLVMAAREPHKDRRRDQEPPEAEIGAPGEGPKEDHKGNRGQARVGQACVSSIQCVPARASRRQTRRILVRSGVWHSSFWRIWGCGRAETAGEVAEITERAQHGGTGSRGDRGELEAFRERSDGLGAKRG
jgi:hypothetical protein